MILDSSHRRWLVVFLALLALATLLYVPYAQRAVPGPTGGSWPGLGYGIVGLGLMLFAGALGLRRKVATWRLGAASTWTKAHLWLGLLSYPLILFHSGFQLGGTLTTVLIALFSVVVVSGIYGVVLQQIIPRMLLQNLPLETVFDHIQARVEQLRDEADRIVAATGALTASESLRVAYAAEIRPYLVPVGTPRGRFQSGIESMELFDHLRRTLPAASRATVDQLHAICDERRQLARQTRLHRWLHGWLLVHVPLSLALLLLSVVHAVFSVRY